MPPSFSGNALLEREAQRPRLRLLERPALRVADVAMFYGERSGGIRTYLEAKRDFARRTGAIEHHVIVPGRREHHADGRHELPSLRLAALVGGKGSHGRGAGNRRPFGPQSASNGYRVPLGAGALKETLRAIEPDVVLLHDAFWAQLGVTRAAQDLGAKVIAVHHSSCALHAHALPGPSRLYHGVMRAWFHQAYRHVDGVMSVVDTLHDSGRPATLVLRLGLDSAFHPLADVPRGDHVLYAGRLAIEKGIVALLEVAASARDPWPLQIVGTGPAEGRIHDLVARLGLSQRVSFRPFVEDAAELADLYRRARCVVMPGEHETFGLVALEAAASGASVVACADTPSAMVAGDAVETFEPGERLSLARAIERARRRRPDLRHAEQLVSACGWERALRAEVSDLEEVAR